VSAALTVSQRGGSNNGRSFERAHIARLQDELGRLYEVESRTLGWRLQRARRRVDYWTTPRLGILRQHPPKPLTVARDEAAAVPPRPAPSIALVTPSLNQAQFIERTLRSVAAQEYPELEHVVRDGGSTDGTLDLLGKHNGALTWHSEPDAGQAAALNAGFAATHGEIMGWLNADDLLLPGALAAVARHFAAHPEIDLIYGHRALIDEEDRQIGAWVMPPHEREAFLWADWIPQETMFFRRSLWERAGGTLDENFHFALDWDLLLRFDAAGARMERLPHTLGAFRIHGAQKTQGLGTLYEEERALLMTRTHGRRVSQQETMDRSRGYLRRHVLHHTLYRARLRLDSAGRVPARF
jgi:GT2 family glycosyltransferase